VQGEHVSPLYADCARPFQTFDGIGLYSNPYLRVAALFHGIIRDHPFADGNKRTATVASIGALAAEQLVSEVSPLQVRLLGEIALFTADSSSGSMTVEEIASWLRRIFDPGLLES
jgi:death on curing protein